HKKFLKDCKALHFKVKEKVKYTGDKVVNLDDSEMYSDQDKDVLGDYDDGFGLIACAKHRIKNGIGFNDPMRLKEANIIICKVEDLINCIKDERQKFLLDKTKVNE
ncbi:7061_t:CDS:2, partial [Cetraspora pellucida]